MPVCREMSELVTDYLERALPARARAGVRWHLWRCPACRAYFAQVRQTVRVLKSLPPAGPGGEAEANVLARLAAAGGSAGPGASGND